MDDEVRRIAENIYDYRKLKGEYGTADGDWHYAEYLVEKWQTNTNSLKGE